MDTEGQMPSGATPSRETAGGGEKKSVGPAVGIIIIVIVLVLGALYFWGRNLEEGAPQGDSLEAVEADLNQSDIDGLEADLEGLDAEVENL